MGWVLPEVVVRRVIDDSFKKLRANKPAFVDIFSQFTKDELNGEYGEAYIEKIWQWFATTKIPVVQAWSFNTQQVPSISIHLANEQEDEQKIAFDDYAGDFDGEAETGVAVFSTMLDIGIHANKGGDHVLWLYYILSYVLFRYKNQFERQGLQMQTYTASDYNKMDQKNPDSVWTRWIRFRCTTQNDWQAETFKDIEDLELKLKASRIDSVDINEDIEL